MQFFIPAILSILVGIVAAAPAEIETRSTISVTYCANTDLGSPCTNISVQSGACTSTSGNVVSFVPSGTKCTLYSGGGCTGDSRDVGPSPALNLDGFQANSFNCQSYSDSWGGW